jgi:hypothetical protein
MNDTVAIVGTSDRTRNLVPYQNKNIDIWVFNSMVVQDWVQRCDVVFDMHKFDSFAIYETKYLNWLKSPDKAQVFYTQTHGDEYPKSVPFPINEVIHDLLPNFVRGEDEKIIPYFTSTVCYALALAIYQGYKRIEFYGIDMVSNTEYIYQRDGIALFMGIAIARGIKVYIPQDCAMFKSPLYGYDDDIHEITWETLDSYATALEEPMTKAEKAQAASRAKLETLEAEIVEARNKGIPVEELTPMIEKYTEATNDDYKRVADCASLHGQYMAFRNLQLRVGKQMEAAGKAQEVIAMQEKMKPR